MALLQNAVKDIPQLSIVETLDEYTSTTSGDGSFTHLNYSSYYNLLINASVRYDATNTSTPSKRRNVYAASGTQDFTLIEKPHETQFSQDIDTPSDDFYQVHWLTFMEKKQAELMNTGHIMDDETFITHLLNSLPQSEYEGAILVIKDKLRKGPVDLPEIEQVLEDKYQAMKHAKGWEEEGDDYALFTLPSNKKKPKKAFKGCCGYCGEYGHKAVDCPNKKSNQNKGQKAKTQQKRKQNGKGDSKGKGHLDMLKIKCFKCGEYGHFPHDCLKAWDNADIAQESEQKGKFTSLCIECLMVCTELQNEDVDEDQVVYGDQGINTEEYEKATYGDLMKTQSEDEDEAKCAVAQRANNSVILERKRRQLNENNPDEKPNGDSQSDILISENHTVKSINKSTLVGQGPADDDDENELGKAWTMEMQTNDSDISTSMMNEEESMSKGEKKFLYARAVHSNHSIQYHLHQIIK